MPSKNVALQNDPGTPQQEAGFGFNGRFWYESSIDPLTALAGGGRSSNTTQINSMYNRVATVASAADSCVLPPAFQGLSLAVLNDATNALQMFAQGSDTINAVAGSTGVPQMGKSLVWYTCHTDGKWVANGIGSGFSGANTTYSYADGLTAAANPNNNQAGGTAITTSTARFTTVATAGDSATLMTSAAGLIITVINAGANIMNLWPAVGDQINALGANNAFAVPPGAVVDLYCTAAGTWHTLMSASGAPQQAYNAVATVNASIALTGAQITGGSAEVTVDMTGSQAGSVTLTLPTVAQLVAAMTVAGLNPQAGQTYELDIIGRDGTHTYTVTTATGWTLTGTMTVTNQMRKFYVTLTSLTAATLRSIGTFTVGAA